MREPFLDELPIIDSAADAAPKPASRRKQRSKAAKGKSKRTSARKSVRPHLPRVPGGKAQARLHFFERQRQIEQTDVKRKKPDKPAAKLRGGRPAAAARTRSNRGQEANAASASPYARAFARKKDLDITAPATSVEQGWRPLGPFSIPHGQTYGKGAGSRPPVAGRIVAVAVDPGNANHILIGAGGGGVWETRDAGKTWEPRTDDQPSLSTGAIAFNPSNPLFVYAGTGEGDSVSAGQPVAIVEAMKMEHTLIASTEGVVTIIHAGPGQPIGLDDPIVTIAAPDQPCAHEDTSNAERKEQQ